MVLRWRLTWRRPHVLLLAACAQPPLAMLRRCPALPCPGLACPGRLAGLLQVSEAALSDPWVRHGDRLALQVGNGGGGGEG